MTTISSIYNPLFDQQSDESIENRDKPSDTNRRLANECFSRFVDARIVVLLYVQTLAIVYVHNVVMAHVPRV